MRGYVALMIVVPGDGVEWDVAKGFPRKHAFKCVLESTGRLVAMNPRIVEIIAQKSDKLGVELIRDGSHPASHLDFGSGVRVLAPVANSQESQRAFVS